MLTQKKTKAIMLGGTPVKRVMFRDKQIWPEEKTYNTMTIRWQETSNPEDFFLEYLDDAAGLTQGSEVFDEFFAYKPVLLNTAGVETAELDPNDFSKDINGNAVNITSGDNVMIKFPTLGVKMEKSGDTVTLSLTKELNKEGYQYYAHQNGSLSSPGTVQSAFYLGTYKAYNNSGTLKSWSGKNPTTDTTTNEFSTEAKANGNGYNIMGWHQRQFVNALYMMKYGNPNSQSVIGQGYTGGSAKQNTGATDTVGMTGATNTSGTGRIKLFGLEDWWGNVHELIGGAYTNGGVLYTQLSGYSGQLSGGESTGITLPSLGMVNLTSIQGNNKGMFAPMGGTGTTYTTHYCDGVYVDNNARISSGGSYWIGTDAGAFRTTRDESSSSDSGSRLQYLPPDGYNPGPTTIAYRPLTSATTVNDQKNSYNLTNQGGVVFGEYKGVDCAYFNMNSNSRLKIASFPTNNQSFTVLAWIYLVNNNATSGRNDQIAFWWGTDCGVYKDSYVDRNTLKGIFDINSGSVGDEGPWTFVAITYDSSTRKGSFYKNDTLVGEKTQTITAGTTFAIGNNYVATGTEKKWKGGVSEVWVDGKVRTAQELSDYYNSMKYKYGL